MNPVLRCRAYTTVHEAAHVELPDAPKAVDCETHAFSAFQPDTDADRDEVRRLAQRDLEGHVPAFGVDAHFAMRDDAAFVVVRVFDRIFDRNDVPARLPVALVQHRGKR